MGCDAEPLCAGEEIGVEDLGLSIAIVFGAVQIAVERRKAEMIFMSICIVLLVCSDAKVSFWSSKCKYLMQNALGV